MFGDLVLVLWSKKGQGYGCSFISLKVSEIVISVSDATVATGKPCCRGSSRMNLEGIEQVSRPPVAMSGLIHW